MDDKHIIELEWHKIDESNLDPFEFNLIWKKLLIFLDELCVVSVILVSKDYLKHVLEYDMEELTKDSSKYIFITMGARKTKDISVIPISDVKYWAKAPDLFFSHPCKDGLPIHEGYIN